MKQTPAVSGRRKAANKMAGDKSAQNIGGDAVTPRTSSFSTPAMTGTVRKGESYAETLFKERLTKVRVQKRPLESDLPQYFCFVPSVLVATDFHNQTRAARSWRAMVFVAEL